MYFSLFRYYLPWEKGVALHLNKLNLLRSRMLCVKLGRNWPSGSGEEDFLNFVNEFSLNMHVDLIHLSSNPVMRCNNLIQLFCSVFGIIAQLPQYSNQWLNAPVLHCIHVHSSIIVLLLAVHRYKCSSIHEFYI